MEIHHSIARELAEMAMSSAGMRSFRREALQHLAKRVGFDLGSVHSAQIGATGHGFDVSDDLLSQQQGHCIERFTTAEIARLLNGTALIGAELFDIRRRDELREEPFFFAWACSVASYGATTRTGAAGLLVVRERGRPFGETERALIDAAGPVLALAECVLPSETDEAQDAWADDLGLTDRETEIARMATRGFRNSEIAQMCRCSELTVRNHLSHVFKKAGVSSRAELAFQALTHLHSAGRPVHYGYTRLSRKSGLK